jgi:hypothetical protein
MPSPLLAPPTTHLLPTDPWRFHGLFTGRREPAAVSDETAVRRPSSALARARASAGLALAGVLLPVGGHVLAGGGAPPLPVVLLLVAALWALLLTRPARRTGPQAVLALASTASAGQLVVHWAATAAHDHPVTGVHGPMLLAHLVATALTVAVLVRGEAALVATARLLARALGALRPEPAAAPAPDVRAPLPPASSDCLRAGRLLAAAAPRRGPPQRERSAPLPA